MNPFPKTTVAALKGLVVGDAFGAPFEYHKKAPEMAVLSMEEQRYLDNRVDVKVRARWARLPGMYTDDGQQALALLYAWNMAEDPLDADAVAYLFMQVCYWMSDAHARTEQGWACSFGLHRGTGGNFRSALLDGEAPDTAGLGGSMRIGPVATLLPDPATLVPWVVRVTQETTCHPLGLAGTVIFALACWRAAHYPWHIEAEDERRAKWEETRADLEPVQRPDEIPQDIWALILEACRVMNLQGEKALVKMGIGSGLSHKPFTNAANGFALTGVPWAIHHGMRGSFQDTMVNVCSSGGDTDTVGAMAGCLAALRLGGDAIPEWMMAGLHGAEVIKEPHTWEPMVHERTLTELEEDHWIQAVAAYSKKKAAMEARAKASHGPSSGKKKRKKK